MQKLSVVLHTSCARRVRVLMLWLCVMSGCRMTRPVICRYVSVSYRLLSVVSCRQGLPRVVETSVTTTDSRPSQDYTHPDDQTSLLHVTPGFKPFTVQSFSLQYQYNIKQTSQMRIK